MAAKKETGDIKDTLEYTLAKEQTLVFIYESIVKDYLYKKEDMEKYYEQVKDIVPAKSEFFISWFKGFVALAGGNEKEAQDLYLKALDKIQSADEYTPSFIQQGFALFMYYGKKKDAVKFWNWGADQKLFARLDDKFFESFNPKEQFWVQFAPNMFTDAEKAKESAIKDYKKVITDKLLFALTQADFNKFKKLSEGITFDRVLFEGVNALYYAIQFKGTLTGGSQKFEDDMVLFRTNQLMESLDFSQLPKIKQNESYFTILHQMKQTYGKSGLAKIMFNAYYCEEDEIDSKTKSLDKIIEYIAANTTDLDEYVKQSEGKMGTTALHLAAEINDVNSCRTLLKAGANPDKTCGKAQFSLTTKDSKKTTTQVPNSFIYRLINFNSTESLKMYLKEFSALAKPSMTAKTDSCNITPLVYFILNTIYTAKDEAEFNRKKALADELIPLFQNAGASLEQNTAFGSAKELLGLK